MGSLTTIAGPRIYLDTNIFIYAVEGFPPAEAQLRGLFARFDRGELHGITSELTLAEVLVKPIRDGKTAIRDSYERLLRTSNALTVAPITRSVLLDAARIRAGTTLKLPDAIHAATATACGCTTYLTNDNRFSSVAALPVLLLPQLL
jgi:predicted nucleic acid-binding protein